MPLSAALVVNGEVYTISNSDLNNRCSAGICHLQRYIRGLTKNIPYSFFFRVEKANGEIVYSSTVQGPQVTNAAPIPYVSAGNAVNYGMQFILDGTESIDPDSADRLTYQWVQISGRAVSLTEVSQGVYSFIAPADPNPGVLGDEEELTFKLIVQDNDASSPLSSSTTTTVVVRDQTKTYYVDSNGGDGLQEGCSDQNNGLSENTPFCTIQRAVDLALAGDTILVRGGTYTDYVTGRYGNKVMVAIDRVNGTAQQRITLKNYPGEQPILDAQHQRGICILIGKARAPGAADYVTVEGFTCQNLGATYVPDAGNNAILIIGTRGVIVRNNIIHGFPAVNSSGQIGREGMSVHGLSVWGPNKNTLIEGNFIHHFWTGLETRRNTGDYKGVPDGVIVRNNFITYSSMYCEENDSDCIEQQNNAVCIGIKSGTLNAVVEGNVTHHCDDAGIVTDDSGGHKIMYNIAFLSDHTDNNGNGPCIKTKPTNVQNAPSDYLYGNIAFLCKASGIEINAYSVTHGAGARVFNNIAYKNGGKGITISGASANDPNQHSIVKNNIAFNNRPDKPDLAYGGSRTSDEFEYNYIGNGNCKNGIVCDLQLHQFTFDSFNAVGDPGFKNVSLLEIDSDGNLTPDILEPLNYPFCDTSVASNCYSNAQDAIAYARNAMDQIFGLRDDSPLIDAGIDPSSYLGFQYVDLLGNQGTDNPDIPNPWESENIPGTGIYDIGAIEKLN